MGRLMPWLAAAPAVVLACLSLVWLGLAVVDRHPFWPRVTPNLAEAAAMHDAGEVARLLAGGLDPNAAYFVRAGLLRRQSIRVTPLEAALEAGNSEVEALLVRAGASRAARPSAAGDGRP